MALKYYKLLDILNKRSISKGELQKMINTSSATIAKLSAHEYVSLDIIDKICDVLQVQPGDIMEHLPNAKAGD